MAKEEKEMKKKVSIKNGKKSVHFMTPMVKIQEEYQDLNMNPMMKKIKQNAASIEALKVST